MSSSSTLYPVYAVGITIDAANLAPTNFSYTPGPSVQASLLSNFAAKVSSQTAEAPFASELSKIPEAKAADIVSDITQFVA